MHETVKKAIDKIIHRYETFEKLVEFLEGSKEQFFQGQINGIERDAAVALGKKPLFDLLTMYRDAHAIYDTQAYLVELQIGSCTNAKVEVEYKSMKKVTRQQIFQSVSGVLHMDGIVIAGERPTTEYVEDNLIDIQEREMKRHANS
jgi:hypothetical protein